MKKIFSLIVPLCLILSGCDGSRSDAGDVQIIDFLSFKQEITDDWIGDFAQAPTYVKLSTNSNNLLFNGIRMIRVFGDRIFISTAGREARLLVYEMDGKGICEVGCIGQGPNEHLQVSHFDIDEEGNIYIVDGRLDKLFIYNSSMEFVSVTKLVDEIDAIKCLSGHRLLFALSSWNKNSQPGPRVKLVDMNLNKLNTFLQYDEFVDDKFWLSDYGFTPFNGEIFYSRPLDDSVWVFSQTGELTRRYAIDFDNMRVPNDVRKDIEPHLSDLNKYYYLKHFTVISDDYLISTLSDKYRSRGIIANRKTGVCRMSREFPLGPNSRMAAIQDNKLISYINPGEYSDKPETFSTLPDEVKAHLERENFVVCIQSIH